MHFIEQDLVSTINGFDALVKIPSTFVKFSSKLIKRLTQHAPSGEFPDFEETITFFKVNNRFYITSFPVN